MITDYCCTADEWSDAYRTYVEQRGYILHSVAAYGDIIKKVGFENVEAIDKTDSFIKILSNELEKFKNIKSQFLAVSI